MQNNNHYSNEIQIEIDDVYGCPGHCPGCVLSTIERKSSTPDMQITTMQNSIDKLIEYVGTLKNLEKINLTYGIADHFLMSDEYLEKTYLMGASLIKSANLSNPYNGIFYTASMIGKNEILLPRIQKLADLSKSHGVPVYIIAVLDPKHLYHKKFSEVYSRNIIEANKIVNKIDLSINLSEEAITTISPEELFDFAQINQFDEVTINWTPTFDNLQYTFFNQDMLYDWLVKFDSIISKHKSMETSYRPVILKTINNLKCSEPEQQLTFKENIEMNLPELVFKSIQINETGDIFPKYEAIGDIAHNPRLGFKPIGNVNSAKSIQDMFSSELVSVEKNVLKQFKSQTCATCDYNKYCANSGFHIYSHILNEAAKTNLNIKQQITNNIKVNECPHIAKKIFQYYERLATIEDSQSIKCE